MQNNLDKNWPEKVSSFLRGDTKVKIPAGDQYAAGSKEDQEIIDLLVSLSNEVYINVDPDLDKAQYVLKTASYLGSFVPGGLIKNLVSEQSTALTEDGKWKDTTKAIERLIAKGFAKKALFVNNALVNDANVFESKLKIFGEAIRLINLPSAVVLNAINELLGTNLSSLSISSISKHNKELVNCIETHYPDNPNAYWGDGIGNLLTDVSNKVQKFQAYEYYKSNIIQGIQINLSVKKAVIDFLNREGNEPLSLDDWLSLLRFTPYKKLIDGEKENAFDIETRIMDYWAICN